VPDVLGYLVIVVAVWGDREFRGARWPAMVAGVASVVTRPELWPLRPVLGPALVQAFFEVLMIWQLCTAVLRFAEARENAPRARAAANARSLTLVAGALNFAYAALFHGFHIAIPYAAMILLAFGWSVVVIVMLVMHHAAAERDV
jgi:hypothetical protein